uniref:Putative mitochondrial 28s ribosomal protein s27 n=2 Tax=Rhodnius TaxID=13248 RepID=R4G398_RHOPR
MLGILKFGLFTRYGTLQTYKALRPFMSDAFHSKDVWNKRLHSNILRKVKLSDLFYELDTKFNQIGRVSAVDIDIFTNAINDEVHLDEMEDLVHRFRLSSEACNILASTQHAFIRAFLSFKDDKDDLIRILNDRLNYGIFPDDYCNILLMDHFIKENNFTSAAKVAANQMLQEDFSNPLVKYFSLYSCHKYLQEPSKWHKSIASEEEDDIKDKEEEEDEVIKVRVGFIRNPYFDDHFDLTDPYSLIGKTFKMIGESNNDTYSNSYNLLGLSLYKKWPNVISFSDYLLEKNLKINSGCINEIEKFLSSLPEEEGEIGNTIQKQLTQIKNNLQKVKNNNLIDEKDLFMATEENLNRTAKELERNIIDEQCQIYEEWENKREEILMNELEEQRRLQRIESVKQKKEELAKKEEELFFFDLEDKLDLQIENKRVPYPPKWLGKKKKRIDSAEYIPPEIIKKRSQ